MGITSADIINNLSANRAKVINILDFDSKKLSIVEINNSKTHVYYDHNPFFCLLIIQKVNLKNMMIKVK